VKFRHPVSGQVAVCSGGYYQDCLIGMANQTAKDLQMRCLDDYQRQVRAGALKKALGF